VQRESDRSFEQFVSVELPRLLGLARALTGNPHDAWDLTQECLVRVGLRWSRIDTTDDPGAYARTTLVRLNIDRLRRLRRERPSADVGAGRREAVTAPPTDEVEPWLVSAMASLTPRQRTAVALRFIEDLDLAGIAARMGCSIGTAKSHLSRGLARLRVAAPVRDASRPGDAG
jgi:RNA polymerase sigma-70 factor (sigma-E family)